MKRILLIVSIVFSFTFGANSQSYPIPAPGSQWGVLTYLGPPGDIYSGNYGSISRYDGVDSIINEQTYQYWGYDRFTRYNDNKLYVIDKYLSKPDSIVEVIYYDFNLAVGDSFLIPFTDSVYAKVKDVSEIETLNGQTRKRIKLWSLDVDVMLDWIEGIGDVWSGVFYMAQYGLYDIHTSVVCFSDSSGDIYKDESFDFPCDSLLYFDEFKIDAGKDTMFCFCSCDTIRLGGNPTVIIGVEPYLYNWKTINAKPASYFLNDTTIANPVVDKVKLAMEYESVTFVLTVEDDFYNVGSDSVTIWAVNIGQTLVYFNPEINKGDTLELPHNYFIGGIEPYTYYWSPDYNISDVNASNPLAWPDTTTKYSVYVIDSIGCKSSSDFVNVTVLDLSGVITGKLNKGVSKVFPNPITNNSVLVFDADFQTKLTLKIVNENGAVIFNNAFSENPFQIGNLIKQSGIYFYTISKESKILTSGKFVKN